jgi:hypothetical protein
MALKQNNVALGTVPMPTPNDAALVAFRMAYTLTGDVAAGDILEMGYLPGDTLPVDIILDCDDMDSGATGTVSVALLNAGKTDIDTTASGGAAWLTAQSIQAATAVHADAAGLRAASRVTKSAANRPLGIKIVGETAASAGQVIGLTLLYRAA